jgi:hypothetical protein
MPTPQTVPGGQRLFPFVLLRPPSPPGVSDRACQAATEKSCSRCACSWTAQLPSAIRPAALAWRSRRQPFGGGSVQNCREVLGGGMQFQRGQAATELLEGLARDGVQLDPIELALRSGPDLARTPAVGRPAGTRGWSCGPAPGGRAVTEIVQPVGGVRGRRCLPAVSRSSAGAPSAPRGRNRGHGPAPSCDWRATGRGEDCVQLPTTARRLCGEGQRAL